MFSEFLCKKIEEKSFSAEDISRLTGVSLAHIIALMGGDYSNLPAHVFVKGYLKKIAAILEVDHEELWSLYFKDYNNVMPPPVDLLPTNRFETNNKLSHQILKTLRYLPIIIVIITVIGFILFQSRILFGEPLLKVTNPLFENTQTSDNPFMIEGEGQPHTYININGKEVYLSDDGKFSEAVQLKEGFNEIIIQATNRIGKTKTITRQIYFESPSPSPLSSPVELKY